MADMNIEDILEACKAGDLSVDAATQKLEHIIKKSPFDDIGYAKVDLHRKVRQGATEVIYGAGKTSEQIIGIVGSMIAHGQESILITRIDEEKAAAIMAVYDMEYKKEAQIGLIGPRIPVDGLGTVLVITAGTSDIPVAEEAAFTAEALGNKVERLYDAGVAGLHRLLSRIDTVMDASVIIAVAGMEGALASVVGGLVDCPVIAVPTSIGYGASFGGMAALLSMLNSCASGISVVNIDNGFGAGFLAGRMNHMHVRSGK